MIEMISEFSVKSEDPTLQTLFLSNQIYGLSVHRALVFSINSKPRRLIDRFEGQILMLNIYLSAR
jgi:hypothetical protein